MQDVQQLFAVVRERQQRMWSTGDWSMISTTQTLPGELLCEAVDLRAGQAVLDIACGSGTTAIAAARRFCTVTGVDYVPALLERAQERAAAERLDVSFVTGGAEELPVEDGAFDAVLSTYGVMFAPNQELAASELLRACRPGGRIGLANWTPEGFVGGMFRATSGVNPPPPGIDSPLRWGTEAGLAAILGDRVRDLRIERRAFMFRYLSPEHWLAYFRAYFGPVRTAFAVLDEQAGSEYAEALLANVCAFNLADDGTMVAPGEYLEVVATKV